MEQRYKLVLVYTQMCVLVHMKLSITIYYELLYVPICTIYSAIISKLVGNCGRKLYTQMYNDKDLAQPCYNMYSYTQCVTIWYPSNINDG